MMKTGEIMRDRLKNNKGFTLIEAIAVLIILGIVSAAVISRGMATADVDLQVEVDTLKSHLRYAQYLAMNENDTATNPIGTPVKWGIRVVVSSYELVKYVGANNVYTEQTHTFKLPNESSNTHSLPINATGTGTVLFDDWGSPDTPIPAIALGGKSITITAETGFIQ